MAKTERATKTADVPKKDEPSIAELLKEFDDGRGYFDDKGLCPVLGLKLKENKSTRKSASSVMPIVCLPKLGSRRASWR